MAKTGRPRSTDEAIDKLARLKRTEIEDMGDQRLSTGLGRLYRRNEINEVEFLAGEGFVALVENYRRMKGLPNGRPKPNQLQPRIPGDTEYDCNPDHVRQVEERYDEIFLAVTTANGTKAMEIVTRVCLQDEFCEWFNRTALRAGLRTIAQKLRL
jgi:hypothetical protein